MSMQIFTLRPGSPPVVIDTPQGRVTVRVCRGGHTGTTAKIGVQAPRSIVVDRAEVHEAKEAGNG